MTRPPQAERHGYDGMGEFHDLFMDEPHRPLRAAFDAVFGGFDADAVVLDLGAGTGLGVRALAQATWARIVAIEPSRTMRAVLLARVADDPGLTARVTVVAGSVPDALHQLPRRVSGFVGAHLLGHLSRADRTATFAALAERLVPGGAGVVTVNPSAAAPAGEIVEERRIGEQRYVARHLPSALEGASSSVYEVQDAEGRVLRAERYAADWTPITAGSLRAELAPSGWRVTARPDAPTVLLLAHEPAGTR